MAEPEDTGPMDEGMDGMEVMGGMEGDMDGMDMEPGMGMEEDDMGQQGGDMSLDEMIVHVERQMREYERNAQYLEAEKARQHLLSLKKKKQTSRQVYSACRIFWQNPRTIFTINILAIFTINILALCASRTSRRTPCI